MPACERKSMFKAIKLHKQAAHSDIDTTNPFRRYKDRKDQHYKDLFEPQGHIIRRVRMATHYDAQYCIRCRQATKQMMDPRLTNGIPPCEPYNWNPNSLFYRPRMSQWRLMKSKRTLTQFIKVVGVSPREIKDRNDMRRRTIRIRTPKTNQITIRKRISPLNFTLKDPVRRTRCRTKRKSTAYPL